jgi:hypothetical protein
MNTQPEISTRLRVSIGASVLLFAWVATGFGLPPLIVVPGRIISAYRFFPSLLLAALICWCALIVILRGSLKQKILGSFHFGFGLLVAAYIMLWVVGHPGRIYFGL